MLMNFKAIEGLLLPVDNLKQSTAKSSISTILDCLKNEEAVIVFPAGEVSRIRPNGVQDDKWTKGFLSFAKKVMHLSCRCLLMQKTPLYFIAHHMV